MTYLDEARMAEYQAQDVRQAEIVLDTPLRRAIFAAGLAGFVFVAFLGAVVALG